MITDLLRELDSLGVTLSIGDEGLTYEAPTGVLSLELLSRMRSERDALRAAVLSNAGGIGLLSSSLIVCPWCKSEKLVDCASGLHCEECSRQAWLLDPFGGLIRVDHYNESGECVNPDLVPTCDSCDRWCDTMTLADEWRCSSCDPGAERRKRTTQRVLTLVEQLRSEAPNVGRNAA